MNAASGLNDDGYEVLHIIVVALLSSVCSFGCGSRVEVGFQVHVYIRLASKGIQYVLDVQVTCPATEKTVTRLRTHLYPGAAAERAYARKQSHHSGVENFVPIIVESGGRIHPKSCSFIRNVVGEGGSQSPSRGSAHLVFRAITSALVRQQSYMLACIAEELTSADLASEPSQ